MLELWQKWFFLDFVVVVVAVGVYIRPELEALGIALVGRVVVPPTTWSHKRSRVCHITMPLWMRVQVSTVQFFTA